MPAGLEVWDAQSRLMVSITDRFTRFIGQIPLANNHGAGSIQVPEFSRGTGFVNILAVGGLPITALPATSASISGNTLSWTSGTECVLIYGVY